MFMILKAAVLFLSIIFILPLVFFLLVGYFGNYFALTVDRDCWLAKTKIRWIRVLVNKFFI